MTTVENQNTLNQSTTPAVRCPACGAAGAQLFFRLDNLPVSIGRICRSADEARGVPCGELELTVCASCELVFNPAFDPNVIPYHQAEYDNSLFHSAVYSEYTRSLVSELIERYAIGKDTVIDVGCGGGDFLAMLHEASGCRSIGFEPSRVGSKSAPTDPPGVRIRAEYFTRDSMSEPAQLLASRYVLEHVLQPTTLLKPLREYCETHSPGAVVFTEVPSFEYIIEQCSVWDLIYEHCLYFTRRSLANVLRLTGFDVLRVDRRYHGQFVSAEARWSYSSTGPDSTEGDAASVAFTRAVAQFADAAARRIQHWNDVVNKASAGGRPIVLWGAGAKGIMLLNLLHDPELVRAAVDVNPNKRGAFIPGTAHPIVSPADLKQIDPGTVIVANPVYVNEISQTLRGLAIDAMVSSI